MFTRKADSTPHVYQKTARSASGVMGNTKLTGLSYNLRWAKGLFTGLTWGSGERGREKLPRSVFLTGTSSFLREGVSQCEDEVRPEPETAAKLTPEPLSPESSAGITASRVTAHFRATSVMCVLARLQLLAFSRGNHGVGLFPRCLANLMNLLALLLLAKIGLAAHGLDLRARAFLDASALLDGALGNPRMLPARLSLLAGGPLSRLLRPARNQSEQAHKENGVNSCPAMHESNQRLMLTHARQNCCAFESKKIFHPPESRRQPCPFSPKPSESAGCLRR